MSERVMIFIDGSNLFHACKSFDDGFRIDYVKLKDFLANGRKLIRPYFYGSFDPSDPKNASRQKNFFRFLRSEGYEVVEKPLRMRDGRKFEKGVDVALVTDMLSLGFEDAYDTTILVSGDGDFVHAIDKIKSMGKRVEVAIFRNAISDDLRLKADKFIALDDYADEIRLK